MQLAKLLIDAAVKVCGSQAAVARELGVKPQDVSKWVTGKRPLSPEDAALLADLGHMDARQAVVDAVIERNAGTRKGQVLFDVLGKALAAGVAGLLVFFYAVLPSNATAGQIRNHHPINYSTHRIERARWGRQCLAAVRKSVFRARFTAARWLARLPALDQSDGATAGDAPAGALAAA